MIHSLAGGKLKDIEIFDLAKVEITKSLNAYWYKFNDINLKVGSVVTVPLGTNNNLLEGVVVKIQRRVSSQVSPIPVKKLKYIFQIVKY